MAALVNILPMDARLNFVSDLFGTPKAWSASPSARCTSTWSPFPATKSHEFEFLVNIQCPHVPITTDSKSPDLNFFRIPLLQTLARVAARARRVSRRAGPTIGKQKHMIYDALPSAIRHASGADQYRFSQRQLFYAVRPLLLEAFGIDPDYNWFCKVLTSYENDYGEIAKL